MHTHHMHTHHMHTNTHHTHTHTTHTPHSHIDTRDPYTYQHCSGRAAAPGWQWRRKDEWWNCLRTGREHPQPAPWETRPREGLPRTLPGQHIFMSNCISYTKMNNELSSYTNIFTQTCFCKMILLQWGLSVLNIMFSNHLRLRYREQNLVVLWLTVIIAF